MRSRSIAGLLLMWVLGSTGCMLATPLRQMTDYTKSMLTPNGYDYEDPTEEKDEVWVTEVGDEGRKGHPRERDPDQWYKKYFMTERARGIEHNLGVD